MACGFLAGAANRISTSEEVLCATAEGKFVQSVLLDMSEHTSPEHNPAHDAAFDANRAWSGPLARIEAAAGLIKLARKASCCTEDVLASIDRLSGDLVPEVRFQIADHLTWLHQTAPTRMWNCSRSGQQGTQVVRFWVL